MFTWRSPLAESTRWSQEKLNRLNANRTAANDWLRCLIELNNFILILLLSDPGLIRAKQRSHRL